MTVKELVTELLKLDQELNVTIYIQPVEDFGVAGEVKIIEVGKNAPYCKGYSFNEEFSKGTQVVVITGF